MSSVEAESLAWFVVYAVVYVAAIACALRAAINDTKERKHGLD